MSSLKLPQTGFSPSDQCGHVAGTAVSAVLLSWMGRKEQSMLQLDRASIRNLASRHFVAVIVGSTFVTCRGVARMCDRQGSKFSPNRI